MTGRCVERGAAEAEQRGLQEERRTVVVWCGRGAHDDVARAGVVFELDAFQDVGLAMEREECFEVRQRDMRDLDLVATVVMEGVTVLKHVVRELTEDVVG